MRTAIGRFATIACTLITAGTVTVSASADSLSRTGVLRPADGVVGWAAWKVTASSGAMEEVVPPGEAPGAQAEEALAAVPAWIRADLRDLLARLPAADRDVVTSLILGVSDPKLLDEVAWTFAYLSPEQIHESISYLDIVTENAEGIYAVDPALNYVDLVEVGVPGSDDWYTTVRYFDVVDGADVSYVLPREIYYSYIVHPVLQDEPLARIVPATGGASPTGEFWRSFYWSDDDFDTYQRPRFLNLPERIEQSDLVAMDFGGPAAVTVLTGPDRSFSNVVRESLTGAPVLLEFVGQGGSYGGDSVPNPGGQVIVTTLAVERAAAAGDDALLVGLLGAGPANIALRPNMLDSSDLTHTVPRGILVLRDRVPYGLALDPVETALAGMTTFEVDIMDSTAFATLPLVTTEAPFMPAAYAKIVVPSDQPLAVYEALSARAADIQDYVAKGGTFEWHADSSVDWTSLAMPYGVDALPFEDAVEIAASSLEIAGFPLLSEVLDGAGILWDGERVVVQGERPFDYGEGAIARTGWWVAQNLPWNVAEMTTHRRGAVERSVLPVRIVSNHYGNCGEIQDVYGAAMRTALVPVALGGTTLDDHMWNEFFDADEWHPLQVDWSGSVTQIDNWGVAYDADTGGGKAIKFMTMERGDGQLRNVLGRYPTTVDGDDHIDGDYSRHVTLRAHVEDKDGYPVDGALVVVASHSLYDASGIFLGSFGVTGPDGIADIAVGEGNDYYAQIQSPLGYIPGESFVTMWATAADASEDGAVIDKYFVYSGADGDGNPYGTVPPLWVTAGDPPSVPAGTDPLHLTVAATAGRELSYGYNMFYGRTWREAVGDAEISLMLLDQANFDLLASGAPFVAAALEQEATDATLDLDLDPSGGDWYVVIASPGRASNGREVTVDVSADLPQPDAEEPYPEPADADADAQDDAAEEDEGAYLGGGGCGCS